MLGDALEIARDRLYNPVRMLKPWRAQAVVDLDPLGVDAERGQAVALCSEFLPDRRHPLAAEL